MKKLLLLILFVQIIVAKELYFPPINSDEWETVSFSELHWDSSKVNALYDFLEQKSTKAFLVLKDGKIVIEKYFGTFSKDSLWYWASAGKTLTATLTGIAQNEGYLSISDKTSDYLGENWTSLPSEKEDLITIRHQLTMTTGLDDGVEDVYCTLPECLIYKADAGTRWAYHNAPYTLLEKVIVNATGKTYNQYFAEKVRNPIGMNGFWIKTGYNNLYISNPRSMARFGLMILAGGKWEGMEIIEDKKYFNEMFNTSQEINKSYGYLWWLNGKESFMVPSLQIKFPGYLFKNAPSDVVSALGKNGQALFVSFRYNLIVVRMGEAPDGDELSFLFYDDMWEKLNELINYETSVESSQEGIEVYPNPTTDFIIVRKPNNQSQRINIFNFLGEIVYSGKLNSKENIIYTNDYPSGIYMIQLGVEKYYFLKIN